MARIGTRGSSQRVAALAFLRRAWKFLTPDTGGLECKRMGDSRPIGRVQLTICSFEPLCP